MSLDGAIGTQKQEIHGAAAASIVVTGGAYGQVGDTVTIQAAQVRQRIAEGVEVIEHAGEVAFGIADFLVGPDSADEFR